MNRALLLGLLLFATVYGEAAAFDGKRPIAVAVSAGALIPYGHVKQSAGPGPMVLLSYLHPLTQDFGATLEFGAARFAGKRLGSEDREVGLLSGALYGRLRFLAADAPWRPYVIFGFHFTAKDMEFNAIPPAPRRAPETEAQLGVLGGVGVASRSNNGLSWGVEARLMNLPSGGPKFGTFLEDRALLLAGRATWRFREDVFRQGGDWEAPGEFSTVVSAGRSFPRSSLGTRASAGNAYGGELLWWRRPEAALGFAVHRSEFRARVDPTTGNRVDSDALALQALGRWNAPWRKGTRRVYVSGGPAIHSLRSTSYLPGGGTNQSNQLLYGYSAAAGVDGEPRSDLVVGVELRHQAYVWGLMGGRRSVELLARVGRRFGG